MPRIPCSCLDDRLTRAVLEKAVAEVTPYITPENKDNAEEIKKAMLATEDKAPLPGWQIAAALWHIGREHELPPAAEDAAPGTEEITLEELPDDHRPPQPKSDADILLDATDDDR